MYKRVLQLTKNLIVHQGQINLAIEKPHPNNHKHPLGDG